METGADGNCGRDLAHFSIHGMHVSVCWGVNNLIENKDAQFAGTIRSECGSTDVQAHPRILRNDPLNLE